jgi:hypothetical protein
VRDITANLTPAGLVLMAVAMVVGFVAWIAAALTLHPPAGWAWLLQGHARRHRRHTLWGAAMMLVGILTGLVCFAAGTVLLRLLGIPVFLPHGRPPR